MVIRNKELIKKEGYLKATDIKVGDTFIFLNDEVPKLYMKATNDFIVNLEEGYVEDIEHEEEILILPIKIISCELVIKE